MTTTVCRLPKLLDQTVEELRRQCQPHKDSLDDHGHELDTLIRFHRSCSWIEQVEKLKPADDQWLVLQWITFNTVYGMLKSRHQCRTSSPARVPQEHPPT